MGTILLTQQAISYNPSPLPFQKPFQPFTAAAAGHLHPRPATSPPPPSIHRLLRLYPPPSPPTAVIFSTSKSLVTMKNKPFFCPLLESVTLLKPHFSALMGDSILTFTPEQYKFFLESCIEEVNRVKAKGNSLHVESWAIDGKKLCDAFGLTTN
ncbi:hypothetical protein Tco_1467806 [Tanacetum coccineum]